MFRATLFTVALSLLLVTMSQGAGWERVATGADDSFTTYVYPESVRAQGRLVEAWLLDDYVDPQPNDLRAGGFYISQETHWLYDCNDGASTLTEVIRYSQHMGGGPEVDRGPVSGVPETMQHAAPQSVAASRLKAVCELSTKQAASAEHSGTTAEHSGTTAGS